MKMILLLLGMLLGSNVYSAHDKVIIYYVPFNIEPYASSNERSISIECHFKLVLRSRSQIATLGHLFTPSDAVQYDKRDVRAKVIIHDRIYYVDVNGFVLSNGHGYKINKDKFDAFLKRQGSGSIKRPCHTFSSFSS